MPAEPEPHGDDAGHQPLLVGKPLGDGAHRRDVPQADADPGDGAVPQIEQRQALHREGEVLSEAHEPEATLLRARLHGGGAGRFREFVV